MTTAVALTVLGLLCTTPNGVEADANASSALIVVALPTNANPAIREVLSRLGGEATSVGFDVRFVDAGADSVSPDQLEALGRGLSPAAVVTFSGAPSGEQPRHSLDVLFLDRSSGRTFVEHFVVEDDETDERAEVIVAVRAVDFIRARLLEALVRRPEPSPPREPARLLPRRPVLYVGAGLAALGTFSGFSPSLAPKIEVGYAPAGWLRLSASAFGFGTRPSARSVAGEVDLDQRYLGVSATAFGPSWRRLRPVFELGGGAYWLQVRGMPKTPGSNTTDRLWTSAMASSAGLSWSVSQHVLLDVRAGALWLRQKAEVQGTEHESLGTLGRPSWLSSALVGAVF